MMVLNKFQRFLAWPGVLVLLSLAGCGGGAGAGATPVSNVSSVASSDISSISGISGTSVGGSSGGAGAGAVPGSVPAIIDVAQTIISWMAPSSRENGDFLRQIDLLSYRVYYGAKSGDYQNTIEVVANPDPQVDLVDLPSGTYFLVVTAVDTDGRESLYSNEFSVTL